MVFNQFYNLWRWNCACVGIDNWVPHYCLSATAKQQRQTWLRCFGCNLRCQPQNDVCRLGRVIWLSHETFRIKHQVLPSEIHSSNISVLRRNQLRAAESLRNWQSPSWPANFTSFKGIRRLKFCSQDGAITVSTEPTNPHTTVRTLALQVYRPALQANITVNYTGLFEMTVGVLTTCHTQYTWDRSICVFLFNRTTLQVFVTYLIGALYVVLLNKKYRVIRNDCWGFNNLSYTIHLR